MWNSSRGCAGWWFARQRLARRMRTEDAGVAGHAADRAWRVRMGALEPACLSYLSFCEVRSWCPQAGGSSPGDVGQGGSRHGGSNLDCVFDSHHGDLRRPPLHSPCPSCDQGGGRAAGGFDQARQVVLGFEQPGLPWLRELKVENAGLHLEAWLLFLSATHLLCDHRWATQILWAAASSAAKWGNWPPGYFPDL